MTRDSSASPTSGSNEVSTLEATGADPDETPNRVVNLEKFALGFAYIAAVDLYFHSRVYSVALSTTATTLNTLGLPYVRRQSDDTVFVYDSPTALHLVQFRDGSVHMRTLSGYTVGEMIIPQLYSFPHGYSNIGEIDVSPSSAFAQSVGVFSISTGYNGGMSLRVGHSEEFTEFSPIVSNEWVIQGLIQGMLILPIRIDTTSPDPVVLPHIMHNMLSIAALDERSFSLSLGNSFSLRVPKFRVRSAEEDSSPDNVIVLNPLAFPGLALEFDSINRRIGYRRGYRT
jgi:hypothetical protein